MKRPPGFNKLTGTAGLWPAQKPGFASLAQSSLGDAGGPGDGFDAGALNVLNAFAAAGGILDAITAAGAAATAAQGAADAIKLADLDAAINAATAASNVQLTKIGAALGLLAQSPSSPAGLGPAPMPPAVIITGQPCGGGGGSGGVGTPDGTVQTAMSIGSYLVSVGELSLKALALLGPIGGIAVAAVGLALLLIHFFGHGCGQACIDAAKAEQIYEAAADNIAAVYKAGMMSIDHALASMVYMIAAGQHHEATFADKQGDAGSKNLTQVIRNEMAGVRAEAVPNRTPFDLTKAHGLYVSGPGWYPDSLVAASNLTDEYLQALSNGGQL